MSSESITEVHNLEHHECWELLRTVSVGRLAVLVDGHPDIFPINYTVDGGTLVFRTGQGTKLSAASGEAPVAVEADGVDAVSGLAWSVVLKGHRRKGNQGHRGGPGHCCPLPLPLAGRQEGQLRPHHP